MTKTLLIWGACFLIGLVFTSCSSLQYRHTDTELKNEFENVNNTVSIDYYSDKDFNVKIRSLISKQPEHTSTILFFHGSPSSLSAWNHYLKDSLLISKVNMIAIDRPGYGYSGFGKAFVSIEGQGAVMRNLIDHYQLKNIIVVGASYGGPLAARLAAIHPEVKAVVMVSPAIDPKQEKKIWQSKFTQWWLTRWIVPTGYRVAGDEKTIHAEELEKLEKDWHKVKVPVLHIHGDVDDIVPFGNVNYTKKTFENHTIIEVPNKGHEIAWRNPEIVIPCLLEIISEN